MIIKDEDAIKRLNSPLNLINKLKATRRGEAMSLFGIGSPKKAAMAVQVKESLKDLIENSESQIKLKLVHDNALDLLHKATETLSTKLEDVRADKLPSVIAAASKTVESIRKERIEATKNDKDREVHYHFYTPQQNKIEDYDVIDVTPAANP